METVIFLTTLFLLAFLLSQSGKVKKAYKRNRIGQFYKVEAKKEKRIVLVKEGNQIVSYFSI